MIELRYNGCPSCLSSAKAVLTALGYFEGRHYILAFHKEHREDRIYEARPDYIKVFSGAILYSPSTESWIDFYDEEHKLCVTREDRDDIKRLFDLEKENP